MIGIGLASLFSDVGHEMATAAMPGLLASLGAASGALGLIEGLADGASSFAKLYSGLYSDRLHRRKPLAVAGYFVTASAMASFAWATSWWHVLLGRVAGWIGRGARSPVRKVLLAEATTPATYGRAFGLERAMDSAGAVVGPLVAIGLLAAVGPRNMYLWTFVPGILAALMIVLLVREKPHEVRPARGLLHSIGDLPADFKHYLVGIGLAGLGDFSNTLLILWAMQAWTPRFGAARANRWRSCSMSATTSSTPFAAGSPGCWPIVGPSIGCSPADMPWPRCRQSRVLLPGDSLLKFAAVFGLSGLYMGLWETVESATAAQVLPKELRGTGFGLLDTVNGIGDFASSAVVGYLWLVSPAAAMSWVIAMSLGGAAVVAWTGAQQNRRRWPLRL